MRVFRFLLYSLFCLCVFYSSVNPVWAEPLRLDTESIYSKEGSHQKVAPGGYIPVRVKLLNFGAGQRVDVTITYSIFNTDGQEVVRQTETVAVETTATFIKNVQLPTSLTSGEYTARSSLLYADQEFPATSEFGFTVAPKYFGLFLTEWIWYISFGMVIVLMTVGLTRIFLLRIERRKPKNFSYIHVPRGSREFYEIVDDIINHMRYHVGDKALEVARKIDGLEINENTGKIEKIDKNPAEVVALLLLFYQREFGRSLDYDKSKKSKKLTPTRKKEINNYIDIIRKYF